MKNILLGAALLGLTAAAPIQAEKGHHGGEHHKAGKVCKSCKLHGEGDHHAKGGKPCKDCKSHKGGKSCKSHKGGEHHAKGGKPCKACKLRGGSGGSGGGHHGMKAGGGGASGGFGGPRRMMKHRWVQKGGRGGGGSFGRGGKRWGRGGYKHKKAGLDKMVLMKGHMLLKHRTELDLTPEQQDKITKALADVKKKGNTLKAQIDNYKIDIHMAMRSEKMDASAVKRLIDKKYAAKTKLAKTYVDVQAAMQKVLSKEQLEDIREYRYGLNDDDDENEEEIEVEVEIKR